MLRSYDRDTLTSNQQISYDILEWYLATEVAEGPFLYHDYPLNQLFGVQNGTPTFLATIHPINNKTQIECYLERLHKISRRFAQTTMAVKYRQNQGILPPRFVLEAVAEEMAGFIETPPQENMLYTSLLKRMPGAERYDETAWGEFADQALRIIEEDVYPAYETLLKVVRDQIPLAPETDGVWHLPNGDDWYDYCLRQQTTTEMTAQEVHDLGLAEVARIQKEMRAELEKVGLGNKTIPEALKAIAQREDQQFPNTDEGREAALEAYKEILREIEQGLDDAFDLKTEKPLTVLRIPEFKESGSPAAYYNPPTLDGSRPGVFFANLGDMSNVPKFGMRTLAYHEGIPGHHFQLSLQQEIGGPTFRKFLHFTAYTEGWALYAEKLAWELGFQDDPYNNLGRLQAEMLRAVRLVVDTGIHFKRWPREQAMGYMLQHTGMASDEVRREVERYVVLPGQACAYKIGELKILKLREKAREALGDRFSLPVFHTTILECGAVPLTMLEEIVNAWIEETRAGEGNA
jgi:uncharacterized protein (DUF885 family)